MSDPSPDIPRQDLKIPETRIPEQTYINLEPRFASLIFTIPNLEVDLPENVSVGPSGDLSVSLKNNGRMRLNQYDASRLEGNDFGRKTQIETVSWHGKNISADLLMANKDTLLHDFFVEILGSEEAVEGLRSANAANGLPEGSFLYRAVSEGELERVRRNGYQYYSHLDPSANFENQEMFDGDHSQVKYYASRKDRGYSGHIMRWKIADPLFYRKAGLNPRRVVPLFSHYLQTGIEISNDGGKTFEPLFS